MVSSSKRARRRRLAQRESSHSDHQMDPANLSGPDSDREEGEDHEILFPPRAQDIVITPSSPGKVQAVLDCDIANMVKTLNGAIAAVSQDTARIQRAYQQLCIGNIVRDKALADLTTMVRECGSSPAATLPYGPPTPAARSRPAMQADVLDADGNVRTADIGITWEDNETFLHGVRVVGPKFLRPTGQEPVMSTPYPRGRDGDRNSSSMIAQPPTPGTWHLGLRMGMSISIAPHRKHARGTVRPRQYSDSTTNPSTGRRGFVISGRWRTSTVGTRTRERYN